MIHNFYPFPVQAAVLSTTFSPIKVRSTSTTTEVANDIEWLIKGTK